MFIYTAVSLRFFFFAEMKKAIQFQLQTMLPGIPNLYEDRIKQYVCTVDASSNNVTKYLSFFLRMNLIQPGWGWLIFFLNLQFFFDPAADTSEGNK